MGYLTRSLSLVYAMHGALVFFLSLDIRRFLAVIKFLAVITILFGVGMLALDVLVGMPLFWILSEGPILIILYGVVLWLSRHVETRAG